MNRGRRKKAYLIWGPTQKKQEGNKPSSDGEMHKVEYRKVRLDKAKDFNEDSWNTFF